MEEKKQLRNNEQDRKAFNVIASEVTNHTQPSDDGTVTPNIYGYVVDKCTTYMYGKIHSNPLRYNVPT